MTDQELLELTRRLSYQRFGRPFRHQIFFNSRLKTTGGRYHLSDHHIDINPLMLTEHDMVTLEGVILHELCHYHLHLLGRDYHHRSRDFRELLKAVGGSRYAPPSPHHRHHSRSYRWEYQCQRCGARLLRQRRFDVRRYVCRHCGGRFRLIKQLF
ncbi:SprT family protein [Limosilactobacillus difficilis]|uniref:SprT family protein n=1 Tax=Limosilactobacillus difficilis TaxID=2991838 RepID=UPI0024BA3733|nr:SprT family protein [Limosilactobacillus difficilis]